MGDMDWLIVILALAAFMALSMAIGWAAAFLVARNLHRKVAALADLFDAGTAKIDGIFPVRRYFLWPSASGLFHGRPASALVRSVVGRPGSAYIRISVAGHFVLPFQVRGKKFSKLGIIRGGLSAFALGAWFLVMLLDIHDFIPRVVVLKFAAAPLLLGVVLLSVWLIYGKIGDIEFPKDARVQVSFPGSATLEFSTDFPSEFCSLIDRDEIQNSISHLIDTRRVDHLRSVVRSPILSRDAWDSNLEANYFYRRRLLNRGVVRETLIDLLALCERIESSRQANESLRTAATQPA
jgi:hypothetical protein